MAVADPAKRVERDRWTLSYRDHGSQALRARALAGGNGRSVLPARRSSGAV
jgi:ribosomal protein L34